MRLLSGPSSGPPSKKKRRAVSDAERKALRDYYFDPVNGKPSHKFLRQWFFEKFQHLPSQSTISESLSATFAHLDTQSSVRPEHKRQRISLWPDLEAALFEWQQRMMHKNATVTGDILREMASIFWKKMPQYSDEEPPKFSSGWLTGFKNRHGIKQYSKHGEVGDVDVAAVEEELKELRKEVDVYDSENIYNMDESALYWKMTPEGTLATEKMPGGKHEKARISINLAVNATGSHRLSPWFIGTAAKPRCFARSGIHVSNFRMTWRANKKAWMTGVIFREYLLWFDAQMTGRKVLLLVDGFSSHYAGKHLDLLLHDYSTDQQCRT